MLDVLPINLPDDPVDQLDVLDAFYDNNELYRKLSSVGLGPGSSVRALRNPAHRIVEFYPDHLWPETLDELPIEAESEEVVKAARQTLEWGNWGKVKQHAARRLAKHGYFFLKAEQSKDSKRGYPKLIQSRNVTEYEQDSRGFIISMRLDIAEDDDGKTKWRTELWEKKESRLRVWIHEKGRGAKIEDLGEPVPEFSGPLSKWGIDFVPFTHAPCQETEEGRGKSAFGHALEGINELNKMASRAHDLLFRHGKPVWMLLRNEAGQGAVSLEDLADVEATQPGVVDIADETLLRAPGMTKMEALIPNIPYEAMRGLMEDMEEDLSHDLPELLYYLARDKGDPSGRAISLGLSAPQAKAKEARYNGETAIMQCVKMCMTLSASAGLEDFQNIGSFEAGDFDDLKFSERQILPQSETEKAETDKAELEVLSDAVKLFQALGLDTAELKKKVAGVVDVDIDSVEEAVPTNVDVSTPERTRALMERLGVSNGQGVNGEQQ